MASLKEYKLVVDMTVELPENMNIDPVAEQLRDIITYVIAARGGFVVGTVAIKPLEGNDEQESDST